MDETPPVSGNEEQSSNPTPTPKIKKTSKKIAPANDAVQVPEAVNELIRDALKSYLKSKHEANKSAAEIDAMVATCQEFLQSFIIFGYDFNGNPITPIFFAHNQQEADALSMYLTKFFNMHIVQQGGQNGPFR